MMFWSIPAFLILTTAAALEGLGAFAYYSHKRCDPFEEGVISNTNQVIVVY